mgnify:CR=1 FL=1
MAAYPSKSDVAPILQVAHTSANMRRHCHEALHSEGPCIVLAGGTRAKRQQTFGTIIDLADQNALQFRAASLVGERRKHTQNSLRKVFDSASEERALLFVDGLDELLTWTHVDEPTTADEDAMPSTTEYFFQRVEAYLYPVVLGVDNAVHVDALRSCRPHLVITHGSPETTAA